MVGTSSTPSARPPARVISAARPEKTVTSPGTVQVAVVPDAAEPAPLVPAAFPPVAAESPLVLPAKGVV